MSEIQVTKSGATITDMRSLRIGLAFFLILSAQAQTAKPPLYFNHNNDGFSANGRWIPADTKQTAAFPTEVELDCDRITKSCVEATAEYYSGHPHVSIDYLQIDKWDTNGITASSSSGICMVRNVTISFSDKTIVQTVSSKTLDQEKLKACKLLGANATELERFVIKNSAQWISDPYGESLSKY